MHKINNRLIPFHLTYSTHATKRFLAIWSNFFFFLKSKDEEEKYKVLKLSGKIEREQWKEKCKKVEYRSEKYKVLNEINFIFPNLPLTKSRKEPTILKNKIFSYNKNFLRRKKLFIKKNVWRKNYCITL